MKEAELDLRTPGSRRFSRPVLRKAVAMVSLL